MTDATGCWVVYSWDTGVMVHSVHADELNALREAVGSYRSAVFVPWGEDVTATINQK